MTTAIKAGFLCCSLLLVSSGAFSAYYPSEGGLYYNGQYYLDAYLKWSSPGPWSVSKPGYEHDLRVHDTQFFTSTCVTWTNLPASYDDCPTAGLLDFNGPVFSFGSFDAKKIVANQIYYGAWWFSSHGTASYSPFTLYGQENKNICPLSPNSIWCMLATQTKTLLSGYYMNWGGYPSRLYY